MFRLIFFDNFGNFFFARPVWGGTREREKERKKEALTERSFNERSSGGGGVGVILPNE